MNDKFNASAFYEKANKIADIISSGATACFKENPALSNFTALNGEMDVQGTNSLDGDFITSLENMEHLDRD